MGKELIRHLLMQSVSPFFQNLEQRLSEDEAGWGQGLCHLRLQERYALAEAQDGLLVHVLKIRQQLDREGSEGEVVLEGQSQEAEGSDVVLLLF